MIQEYSKTKEMNKLVIIQKLIGDIDAIGDSNIDEQRYENLKEFAQLTREMVKLLCDESRNIKNYQHSVHKNGAFAVAAVKYINTMTKEYLDDLYDCSL